MDEINMFLIYLIFIFLKYLIQLKGLCFTMRVALEKLHQLCLVSDITAVRSFLEIIKYFLADLKFTFCNELFQV